jgi:hypothetical protein
MSSKPWGLAAAIAIAIALLGAAVPGATAAGLSEGITVETSAGPVTCAPDPEREPGPEAISATPFARGERIAIRETGALRCQIPAFGEVEVTGAGLPWLLTLNEKSLTARLKGTRKPGLLVHPVGLPSLACLYRAGNVLGTIAPGDPLSVSVSVARVRLNKAASSVLCPALGPLSLDLTLP